jgi:hypothetical protein
MLESGISYFVEHRNGLQICSKIKLSMGCGGARYRASSGALSLREKHPVSIIYCGIAIYCDDSRRWSALTAWNWLAIANNYYSNGRDIMRLEDHLRASIRTAHYSIRTEEAYVQ